LTAKLSRLTPGALLAACGIAALIAAVATAIGLLIDVEVGAGGTALRMFDVGELWTGLGDGERSTDAQVFYQFRLPRVLAALAVGGGLAAAGCAFQSVLRNPLAEPYTLGVSSGSALAAVIAIRFGLDQTVLGHSGVGLAALIGAGVTVYVVWRLGRVGSDLPPATLLLAGITIAMFCSAGSMFVQYTADFSQVYRIVRWMMGGLDGVLYGPLWRTSTAIVIGCVVLVAQSRDLNALSAGPEAAASVGVNPTRTMTIAFFTASLIVGASIALAGPIGFVGLMVPHAARALVGPDHRVLVPVSILGGGALLVLCDTVSRIAIAPAELPVGVVTALIGGPFFLYLLLRSKGRGRLWGG
jgi:iron complex transport system permease protein